MGKMLLGVAVVRRDGAPAGYGRALLRCLGRGLCLMTLGLGRLLALYPTSWRERGRSRSGLTERVRRYSASQTVSSCWLRKCAGVIVQPRTLLLWGMMRCCWSV